jgi:crotonobetainyl-CoA:carnitine CoA-transferase CaiB-like acyl-CoA transferase
VPAGAAIVDQHGAALMAMAILGALYHRERTGEGQRVEVVMMQAAFDLQTEPLVYYLNGGDVRLPKYPLASTFHQAPYGVYQTADGYMVLSVTPMKTVAAALGDPPELRPYTDDPSKAFENKDEIYAALAPILRRKTTAEWLATLEPQGVWCAPVNDYAHLFEDPVVQAVNPVLDVEHPRLGTVKLLKHPVRYSSGEPEVRRAPPELGEHTSEVLRELGYIPEEIERLRDQGAV